MSIPFHISIFSYWEEIGTKKSAKLFISPAPALVELRHHQPAWARQTPHWRSLDGEYYGKTRQDPMVCPVCRCVRLDGQFDCFLNMGDPPMLIMWTSCLGASLNPGQSCTDKELGWQRVGLQCWVKRLGGANTLWRMILRLRFGLKRGRKYFAASNSFCPQLLLFTHCQTNWARENLRFLRWNDLNLT